MQITKVKTTEHRRGILLPSLDAIKEALTMYMEGRTSKSSCQAPNIINTESRETRINNG